MKLINLQMFAAPKISKKENSVYDGGNTSSSTSTKTSTSSSGTLSNANKGVASTTMSTKDTGGTVTKTSNNSTKTSAATTKGVANDKNAASANLQYESPTESKVVVSKKPTATSTTTINPSRNNIVIDSGAKTDTGADTKIDEKADKTGTGNKDTGNKDTGNKDTGNTNADKIVAPGASYEAFEEWMKGQIPPATETDTSSNVVPTLTDTSMAGISTADSDAYANSVYVPSSNVTQADTYLQQMLELIRGGRTTYSDRLDELINQYLSRDKFSYDPNSDMLFQNALNSAMASGQRAMQDTMGQAAGLTGGYGSSYATTAANEAYNNYVSGAYDNLSDYYNMALNQYQMEGSDMLSGLSLVADQDAREWDRVIDAFNSQYGYRNTLSDEDFRNYDDRMGRWWNVISTKNSDYWNQVGADQWQTSFDRGVYESDRDYNYKVGQDKIDNDYRQGVFDYNVTQAEAAAKAEAEEKARAEAEAAALAENSIDIEGGAAIAYKNQGVQGVYDYLERQHKSDPNKYTYDNISKIFASITGQDFSKYQAALSTANDSSNNTTIGTMTANEVSMDKFNILVDAYINYYKNGGDSPEKARLEIAKVMESNSKYFDQFSEEAISEIIDKAVTEGSTNLYLAYR